MRTDGGGTDGQAPDEDGDVLAEGRERPSWLTLPQRARVVIIGGGVIGTSVAYHLATAGCRDVLLLEQGQLSCGTTWHAAGLVGQLRASESGTRLVQYSTELYSRLATEVGQDTGFVRCGGVIVARTPERMVQLRRTAAAAEAYGLKCEIITPQQAAELWPVMDTSDLCRRDLAARRRQGQPRRPHLRAGQGGQGRRRGDRRAHQGHRHPVGPRRGDRGRAPRAGTSRPRSWSTAPASGPSRSARGAG